MTRHFLLAAALAVAPASMPAAAADPAAVDESVSWVQRVDGELKKPRYAELTPQQIAAASELRLGGHRKSDNKHLDTPAAEFRHLAALTAVRKLNVGENDGVTDAALAHIGALTHLTELVLWDAPITDPGMRQLTRLTSLVALDLGFATRITTASLASIVQLKNLERLSLAGTKVDDVSSLAQLTRLKELKLGKLAPRGIEALRQANPALVVK